jgi:PAS domain-containing protein
MIICEHEESISMSKALELSSEGRVICDSSYPHKVLFANKAWTIITGYEQHEVIGKTLQILQGPKTDIVLVKQV